MNNDRAYSIAITVVAISYAVLAIIYGVKYKEETLRSEQLEQSLKQQKDVCAIQNVVMDACEEYINTIETPDANQKTFIQAYDWADNRLNEH